MSASLHHFSILIQYSSFNDTICPYNIAASFKKMPASFSSFPPSSLPFCPTAALMSHPGNVFHTHHFAATFLMFLISGLCPKAAMNCALLCYCTVSSSNFLLAFQDNLLVPTSKCLPFLTLRMETAVVLKHR